MSRNQVIQWQGWDWGITTAPGIGWKPNDGHPTGQSPGPLLTPHLVSELGKQANTTVHSAAGRSKLSKQQGRACRLSASSLQRIVPGAGGQQAAQRVDSVVGPREWGLWWRYFPDALRPLGWKVSALHLQAHATFPT